MVVQAYDKNLEVNGQYLLGIIGSLQEDEVKPYREKHGLTEIDPNEWYSAGQVFNFYNDIANAPNGMFNLVAIGLNVVKSMEFPPHVRTMSDALKMAREMHYAAWRNGMPGDLKVEQFDENHVRFTFENLPLPNDLIYGLCYGMVKRFAPPGANIAVVNEVRDNALIYNMTW